MDVFWYFARAYWWAIAALILLFGYKLVFRLFGIVIIAQDSVGIINKKFVLVGRNRTLPDGAIIALNGEAGIQADIERMFGICAKYLPQQPWCTPDSVLCRLIAGVGPLGNRPSGARVGLAIPCRDPSGAGGGRRR